MAEQRPAVPAALKRALYEESGYRCAVTTCRGTSALEMAHIRPWSEVKAHQFENMIVLCAVDHTRYDHGEIARQSIEVYKANLALLHGRYSDAERRVLEAFAAIPANERDRAALPIAGGTAYTMMFLQRDGLVDVQPGGGVVISGLPSHEVVTLTEKGRQAVDRLLSAQMVDPGLT